MKFFKMSGAGNDFVLIEGARKPGSWTALARKLCDRRGSVGADGLLVVSPGRTPFVDYYNADGSRAFCGNGSRCAAWWLKVRRGLGRKIALGTIEGRVEAEILGPERVRVHMPAAKASRRLRITAAGKNWTANFIKVGAPHAVISVASLDNFPVESAGRAVRRHAAFRPAGTNVDFIKTANGTVEVRTYERGVEGETLACGTGVTASALCAHELKGLRSPVKVRTQGGEVLKVSFKKTRDGYDSIWLEGPARITFQGELPQ